MFKYLPIQQYQQKHLNDRNQRNQFHSLGGEISSN